LCANAAMHPAAKTSWIPRLQSRPAIVVQWRNRDRLFEESGSFGGPVRIPHLYNGRDKTFFFVNYDRTAIPN
jgi:hypothetical protein